MFTVNGDADTPNVTLSFDSLAKVECDLLSIPICVGPAHHLVQWLPYISYWCRLSRQSWWSQFRTSINALMNFWSNQGLIVIQKCPWNSFRRGIKYNPQFCGCTWLRPYSMHQPVVCLYKCSFCSFVTAISSACPSSRLNWIDRPSPKLNCVFEGINHSRVLNHWSALVQDSPIGVE